MLLIIRVVLFFLLRGFEQRIRLCDFNANTLRNHVRLLRTVYFRGGYNTTLLIAFIYLDLRCAHSISVSVVAHDL